MIYLQKNNKKRIEHTRIRESTLCKYLVARTNSQARWYWWPMDFISLPVHGNARSHATCGGRSTLTCTKLLVLDRSLLEQNESALASASIRNVSIWQKFLKLKCGWKFRRTLMKWNFNLESHRFKLLLRYFSNFRRNLRNFAINLADYTKFWRTSNFEAN